MIEASEKLDFSTAEYDRNPTRRLLRNGCFAQILTALSQFQPKEILLALGEKSFRSSEYYPKLEQMLSSYRVVESLPIPQNPTQRFVQEEINRFRSQTYDLVLAIGGGSVMDVGKILAVIPKQKVTDLTHYMNGSCAFESEPVPLLVLPTTAGSGSEVTPYASLETNDKKKITLSHTSFYPSLALIDPELCYSMPAYVTASTGFDALSQAIESFWSIHATPFSRTHALRALDMSVGALNKVVHEPQNANARFDLSFASCEAGLAIAQTKTTAVHSVSYPITTHFRIAHGHACALTLSSFIRFNAPVLKEEGRPLLNAWKVASYEDMADEVDHLMEGVGLQRKLSSLDIPRDGLELIIRDGFRADRIKNNPREVTKEALRNLLNQIY